MAYYSETDNGTLKGLRTTCPFSPLTDPVEPISVCLRETLQAASPRAECGLVLTQLSSILAPRAPFSHTSIHHLLISFQSISPALSFFNYSLYHLTCHFWLVLRAICNLPDNKRPSSEQVPSSIQNIHTPYIPGIWGKGKSVTRSHSSPIGSSCEGFGDIQLTFLLTVITFPPPSCFMPLPAFPHASQSLLPISPQASLPGSRGITFPSLNHMLFFVLLP